MDDQTLLRQYTEHRSEAAFAALVSRHVDKVYSVAFRRAGNIHAAEEITQAVFVLLAKGSERLGSHAVLTGWLYETARLTALTYIRGEIRRVHREQEAHMQSSTNDSAISKDPVDDTPWSRIAPLLDDAMAGLSEIDRSALVLRFLDGKSLAEVGVALGASEDAAKKRVLRALDKLRRIFTRQGVILTTTVLATVISENSVQAAPMGLAATVTTAGATGAAISGSSLPLVESVSKAMAWAKLKLAFLTGLWFAAGSLTVVMIGAGRGESDARGILERSKWVYSKMRTYQSVGTTLEEIKDGRGIVLNGTFSMRLSRPEFYRVEYEQVGPFTTNRALVWANTNGHYFNNLMEPVASRDIGPNGNATRLDQKLPVSGVAGIQQNLGDIIEVSGGAVSIIPSMFYGLAIPKAESLIEVGKDVPKGGNVKNLTKEPDEPVEGLDCHVISYNAAGEKVWLWIGKQDALIHQSRQRRIVELADLSDKEVAGWLKANRSIPGTARMSVQQLQQALNDARRKANASGKSVTISFDMPPGQTGIRSVTIEPPSTRVRTQKYLGIVQDGDFGGDIFAEQKPLNSRTP